jgi:hypothetical protein
MIGKIASGESFLFINEAHDKATEYCKMGVLEDIVFAKSLFVCNPNKNKKCTGHYRGCGECFCTTHKNYAAKDSCGRYIIVDFKDTYFVVHDGGDGKDQEARSEHS